MKNDLLCLIEQIDYIKSFFHIVGGTGIPQLNVIYDKAEFSAWKQELQLELEGIHDRTHDKFIWSTLTLLKQGFSGWKDEQSYNELSGSLLAIRKNIDKYYPAEINRTQNDNDKEEQEMPQKSPKVFISHSSQDKDYVSCIVDFLEDIGLTQEQLFCSSIPGYGIPLDEDIYDYLKQQFQEHNLHVILVLSDNYYQSVACMNEMGAAWILQNKYTTILLPGFEFKEIKGAINPRKIGLKLDGDLTEVKEKLGQLKDALAQEFGLASIPDVRWERKRDTFISAIPEPDEPMTQAFRLRALAGILGRVFMVKNSVPVRMTLFSNLGSTNGFISASVPQRAEPYSISRRNFRAFLILDCTTKYSITAPATPTARSRRPSPGA